MENNTPTVPEHIDKLIYREVAGTITENEYKILLSWMYEVPANWAWYTSKKQFHEKKVKEQNKRTYNPTGYR